MILRPTIELKKQATRFSIRAIRVIRVIRGFPFWLRPKAAPRPLRLCGESSYE
jgi:hypothetical protein